MVQKKLAEAASLNEGVQGVLAAVGARFGWDVGAFWAVDSHDGALRLSDMWHADPAARSGPSSVRAGSCGFAGGRGPSRAAPGRPAS